MLLWAIARCAFALSTAVVTTNNQSQCQSLDQNGVPDAIRTVGGACTPLVLRSLIRPDVVDSWALLLFWAFIHFEGNWACLVAAGSHRYRGQSAQRTALAVELGDRRKENEKEREMEAYLQWKRKDRGQGARRLPRKPRRSVSCSFLQFRACSGQKSLGRPARIALDFLSAESSLCLLAKAVEPDWILWRLLRYSKTFWRVLLEEWRGFDWRLTGWSRTWNSAKKFKVPTLPLFQFFFFFFLSKDLWKTKRNPSKPKVVYLKKYRFRARKVEDSEHAIYDVCERVRCSLTESRPPAVRRPAPSQIKMYGFCRLFCTMVIQFINFYIQGLVTKSSPLSSFFHILALIQ